MKKIFISAILVTVTALVSCSTDADSVNDTKQTSANANRQALSAEEVMQDFMKNKATINFPRVKSSDPKETNTAKSFALVSYSDEISATTL